MTGSENEEAARVVVTDVDVDDDSRRDKGPKPFRWKDVRIIILVE